MLSGQRVVGIILAMALAVWGLIAPSSAAGDDPAQVGEWTTPFSEFGAFDDKPPATPEESLLYPPAVSVAVLPDGRVLYWGGLEGLEDSNYPLGVDAGRTGQLSRARLLNLTDGTPSWGYLDGTVHGEQGTHGTDETGRGDDMFCADQRVIIDPGTGEPRVVVTGGTIYTNDPVDLTPLTGDEGPGGTADLLGSDDTRVFDPATNTFTLTDEMDRARWYPTLVTQPDGKLFVASGVERLIYNSSGFNVAETETYDPAAAAWTSNGATGDATLPLFARLHVVPDGKILYDGSGQMWSPFGQAVDEPLWNFQRAYDPATKTWQTTGVGAFGARSGTFSVMLPLRAPYDAAQILVGGGTLGTSPGSYVANALTEIVTYRDGETTSERAADLNVPRWYSSGVLLPDGTVLAVSGGDKDEVIVPGTENAVRGAELFDGERWIPLASSHRDRTYHNSAVLLADGSVLVAGHSPINAGYGAKGDNTMHDHLGHAHNMKDPSFEIFRPPYLFRGQRPVIHSAPEGIAWEGTFDVKVSDGDAIQKVVLVRLPSTTHVTDPDMRAVELEFEEVGSRKLRVTAPPSGNVAPPGFYYLFALAETGEGLTPSKARVVRLSATPSPPGRQAPAPMGL